MRNISCTCKGFSDSNGKIQKCDYCENHTITGLQLHSVENSVCTCRPQYPSYCDIHDKLIGWYNDPKSSAAAAPDLSKHQVFSTKDFGGYARFNPKPNILLLDDRGIEVAIQLREDGKYEFVKGADGKPYVKVPAWELERFEKLAKEWDSKFIDNGEDIWCFDAEDVQIKLKDCLNQLTKLIEECKSEINGN